jgi:hypothetical protein
MTPVVGCIQNSRAINHHRQQHDHSYIVATAAVASIARTQ